MSESTLTRAARRVKRKLGPVPAEPPAKQTFDEADVNKQDLLGFAELVMRRQADSCSQLGADLWVLYELGEMRDGYFVEFGAADGHFLSNSWLLEAHYGWNGILAEPNATVIDQLRANRPNCAVDSRAVYHESGTTQTLVVADIGVLSALTEFAEDDQHAEARRGGQEIEVTTVTLDQLLDEHNAPDHINYMSIDTEGGEAAILEGFDFDKRTVDLISVEHNNVSAERDAMYELLTSRGYERRFVDFSKFDDWYVRGDLKS